MNDQIQALKFSEIRAIVARAVREESTPDGLIQAARESLQVICQAAAVYGLTTADVVKALLRPVFEERRSCDCPACKAHRIEIEEEILRLYRALTPVTDPSL